MLFVLQLLCMICLHNVIRVSSMRLVHFVMNCIAGCSYGLGSLNFSLSWLNRVPVNVACPVWFFCPRGGDFWVKSPQVGICTKILAIASTRLVCFRKKSSVRGVQEHAVITHIERYRIFSKLLKNDYPRFILFLFWLNSNMICIYTYVYSHNIEISIDNSGLKIYYNLF